MAEAELRIKSDNIEQSTKALDEMIKVLDKATGSTQKNEGALDENTKAQKKNNEQRNKGKKPRQEENKNNEESTKRWKQLTDAIDKSTKQVQIIDGPLGGIASRMTALNSILKSGAVAWAAVGLAAGLALHQVAKGVGVAADAEVTMKTFEAQLEATGYTAGYSADELDRWARSMALATLDSSDDLRNLVTVMNTFRNVSGKTFLETIKLAQDMGKALKQDPVSAARTLGKALDNPLKNYQSLSRAGIKFSKEQAENIRLSQLQGDVQNAQKIILDELKVKFQGVSAAQADTLRGDIDTFGQKWEELTETIGEKLLPSMRKIVKYSTQAVDALDWAISTDEDLLADKMAESFDTLGKSLPELQAQMAQTRKEAEALGESTFKDLFKGAATRQIPLLDLILGATTGDQKAAYETELQRLQDAIDARIKSNENRIELINEEWKLYVEGNQRKIQSEARLTAAFLQSIDTRAESYRKAKAAEDALVAARKLGVEGDKEKVAQLEREFMILSDLTETRVKHNTAMQIYKSIENQAYQAQKQMVIQEYEANGALQANTQERAKQLALIEAEFKILQAGLDPKGQDAALIREQAAALGALNAELVIKQQLDSIGLARVDGGIEAENGEEAALRARNEELRILEEAGLENMQLFRDKQYEIEERYAEKVSKLYKDTRNYKRAMLAAETADHISAGLETLSAVAGNNKALAKLAKVAAIFSASTSFVQGLAEANKLPYPANIPAYAQAFATGTSILLQARQLNEPSFAFGGVDIQGAGTGRSDSINARIASGESVITAAGTARHKGLLERINKGLNISGANGSGVSGITIGPPSIVIQGSASEETVGLIDERLRAYEDRVYRIAKGASLETIQEENEVGGIFDPI